MTVKLNPNIPVPTVLADELRVYIDKLKKAQSGYSVLIKVDTPPLRVQKRVHTLAKDNGFQVRTRTDKKTGYVRVWVL